MLTQAGFVVKVAMEVAYEFDLHRGDVFTWITDMGWIMGPLSVMGVHANGGTLLLYEGAPNTPTNDRVWELVERHRVAVLGVSPTLIRSLKAAGPPPTADLSSLRVFGASGEPWDEDAYRWLALTVGEGKRPLINFSGGTEVGGAFLSPYPVEPLKVCSLGGPSLGMDVDVFVAVRRVRARLGRRAGVQAAVAGDDARRVPRPGALPRVLLVDVPGRLAPRRLGEVRRRRPVVRARALRRGAQRGRQARRAGRGRVRAAVAPGRRRGGDDRRPGRHEGRGDLVLLDAGRPGRLRRVGRARARS